MGVEDEFADSYIFALSLEATALIYVVAYIFNCTLQLELNCDQNRTRNTMQFSVYTYQAVCLTFRLSMLFIILGLTADQAYMVIDG